MFFYPICVGHFIYDAGYRLDRENYDSFLVELIQRGSFTLETNGQRYHVTEGNVVIVDCYKPHKYYSDTGWESLWLHFDGVSARNYYEQIIQSSGPVMSLKDNYHVEKNLNRVFQLFHTRKSPVEALMSQYICAVLTDLLVCLPDVEYEQRHSHIIEDTVTYINENLCRNLSIEDLSEQASLSSYHFIRVFKRETGYTPHEYIVLARTNLAKYLLKNTTMSVKEVSLTAGYSSESIFCTSFRKREGFTPSQYRSLTGNSDAAL